MNYRDLQQPLAHASSESDVEATIVRLPESGLHRCGENGVHLVDEVILVGALEAASGGNDYDETMTPEVGGA